MSQINSLSLDLQKIKKIHWPKIKSMKNLFIGSAICLAIFIILMAGLAYGYQYNYKGKLYPGTTISQLSVGGLNIEEAKDLLKPASQKINNLAVIVKNSDTGQSVSMADLGVEADLDKTINIAYGYGRDGNYLVKTKAVTQSLFYGKDFDYQFNFDEEKLASKLNELVPELNKEAANATFVVKGDAVSIKNEEFGQKIDLAKFKSDLLTNINMGFNQPIVLATLKTNPQIYSYQIESLKDFFEQTVAKYLTFTDEEMKKNYLAGSEAIAGMLQLRASNNGVVSLEVNQDAIKTYADELAKKVDKKVIDKKVNAQTGEVISEGQDGRTLDQEKLIFNITQRLNSFLAGESQSSIQYAQYSNSSVTNAAVSQVIVLAFSIKTKGEQRVLPEEVSTSGGTAGLFEGKYAEINLAEQRLYLFDGVNQIASYVVSTGKWSMPTPIGTRYIEDKNPRAWSEKYGLYMPYWNSIGGGYGIHELPEWPGGYKEGENHLGTPVSHGCIRLGVGSAEFVYNWAPVGTPVYIHK